jgi:hypothetical protein
VKRLDLDSHNHSSVFGKDALVFNYFDHEVTVSGYDPDGDTKSL